MSVAVVALTLRGAGTADRLTADIPGACLYLPDEILESRSGVGFSQGVMELIRDIFLQHEGLILIMAVGIAVRVVGPLACDKMSDPAVVVVDDAGRYAVSLLSGHEGGANALALQAAAILDAEPVITTASESGRDLVVGIGCRKDSKTETIIAAIEGALTGAGRDRESVCALCTVDLKRESDSLQAAAHQLDRPLVFVSRDGIRAVKTDYRGSDAARRHLGVDGVSEPAALIVARTGQLLAPKVVRDGVTVALALRDWGSNERS